MTAQARRLGFTQLDLLASVLVIGLLGQGLLPGLLQSREAARRAQCLNNLKQIGLAFQNMESALRTFPPSCHVKKDANGRMVAMGGVPGAGWSWCVDILPYMEQAALYQFLDLVGGTPLEDAPGVDTPHANALATVVDPFHCPSFRGNTHVDMTTTTEAITNYKALAATHLESLNSATPQPTKPRYGNPSRHPDGGIFPGSRHGISGFKTDGSAHSALVAETVEQHVARWTVGIETAMVGLPPAVTFEKGPHFYYPKGHTVNKHFHESTIPSEVNRTYLDWNYRRIPYSDGGVSKLYAGAKKAIRYGPSSHHPGVVNHGFADGSVHTISNAMDAALYMFIITRNGGDPVSTLKEPTDWGRRWTDVSGLYSIRAELIAVEGGKAKLRKINGTLIEVPVEKLSARDRGLLESSQKP